MINLVIKSLGIALSILGILFSLILIFALQGLGSIGPLEIFHLALVLVTAVSFPLILYGFIVNYESEISKWASVVLIVFHLINAIAILTTYVKGDAEISLILMSPAILYFFGHYFKDK